jgi:hypothetical protein
MGRQLVRYSIIDVVQKARGSERSEDDIISIHGHIVSNGFILGVFSWSNRRQGADRTLGLLPNGRFRLIGIENRRHEIS